MTAAILAPSLPCEERAAVICACPHCGADIRASMRLSYPERAVGAYAPVYRCRLCSRYVGAPVVRDVVE